MGGIGGCPSRGAACTTTARSRSSPSPMSGAGEDVLEPGQDSVLDRYRGRSGDRPARGLLPLGHGGQAPDRPAPQRRDLQPRAPQSRSGAGGHRQAMQRFDIGNHHFPSRGAHRAGAGAWWTAPRLDHQGGLRLRRRRGHRHRAQERPARRLSGARSSRSSRPTTATPAWRSPPATTGSRRLFLVRPARRVRRRSRSTTSTPWRTRWPGRRRGRGDHGDHPGDLRLPAAAARLPRGRQGARREVRHASTSPTRCRPG